MKQCQKTYNNIIYLRESKITIKDNAKYYELTLSTKALNKGYIQDKDTFIKEYYNYLKSKHLNKFLWNKKLLIITNYLYSFNEKRILKDTFKEIGHKKRLFIINENDKLLALIDKLKINYYYYQKKYIFF